MTTPAALHDTVLHYIHDPLCGWCYGAAPLVAAARAVLPVQAHGGGMMAGRNRRRVDAQLRDYVMPHDERIAQMTGQAFGEPYFNGLLRDTEAVFDSAPPIAAVLAVQAIKGEAAGLDMLAVIQRAHYQQGRRISEVETLTELAQTLAIEPAAFIAELQRVEQEELANHIEASRELLNYVGGRGFPTFVLQRGDTLEVLDTGRWLGRRKSGRVICVKKRPPRARPLRWPTAGWRNVICRPAAATDPAFVQPSDKICRAQACAAGTFCISSLPSPVADPPYHGAIAPSFSPSNLVLAHIPASRSPSIGRFF